MLEHRKRFPYIPCMYRGTESPNIVEKWLINVSANGHTSVAAKTVSFLKTRARCAGSFWWLLNAAIYILHNTVNK